MKRALYSIFLLTIFHFAVNAQIINGLDTLYGNEWINFDQSYFKIMVAEDGMYRLDQQQLQSAGVPTDQVSGSQYQLFHNGEEIAIYSTSQAVFTNTDYIEFYGEKNRSQLDRHLFLNPEEEMMNPYYSLFTDTSAYFLTWTTVGSPKRYEEVSNDLTNLPLKQDYYLEELVQEYHSSWAKEQNGQGVSLSNFTKAEGFSSSFTNSQEFTLNPNSAYSAGQQSKLHIRYSGNLKNHQQLITLNGQTLTTDEFYGYEVRQLEFDVNNSLLSSAIQVKFQGLTDGSDRQRIGYLKLVYPRLFDFEGKTAYQFNLASAGIKQYLEINNFASGNNTILYDLTNNERIATTIDNSLVKIAIPPSQNDRKLLLLNGNTGYKTPSSISETAFVDYGAIDANFIFLSNPRLYDDGNGNNYVQEYADYRSSADGGNFQPVIVDIQQVYDQFGWGLNRHSLSVRNFAHFVKKNWSDPQYFFIVGKGREYNSQRTAVSDNLYVPTFGVPGSDNQLMAGEDGFTPVIPIGRIAVQTEEDILIYLDKVKEFEGNRNLPQTIEDRAWMKRVLHLGGGASAGEQSSIKSYLKNMELTIEEGGFGAEVTSFFKTSTDPIQIPQTQQIFEKINSGLSIITFFGHSGVNAFDFSIDQPINYENKGKYPMMISLGCYSGNVHTGNSGVAENFIFFEDRGAIAFGATSGLGYISSLYSFSNEFYYLLGNELYGQGLGNILQETIKRKEGNNFGINLIRQQFSFHGDPALKLNPSPGADFVVDAHSFKLKPEQIPTNLDSFDICFQVANIGQNIYDSISVKIIHELPDGIQHVAEKQIKSPAFSSEISCRFATGGREAAGLNNIYVTVDFENQADELPSPMAEMNNEYVRQSGERGYRFFVSDNSVLPIYPIEFGIAGKNNLELKATTSPLLPSTMYLFELDTTELFDSPIKLAHQVTQKGGVLRWQPSINWENERVYYWRVSPDSLSPDQGYIWNKSSFIFLENSSGGWSQSHFYQFKKNVFVNMQLPTHGNFDFISDYTDFNVRNAVNAVKPFQIYWNNALWANFRGFPNAGVNIMWLDSVAVTPKTNDPNGVNYGIPIPYKYDNFLFDTTTPDGRKELIDFLDEVVTPGEHIILATLQRNLTNDYLPQDWAADSLQFNRNIFQILEEQGATLARQLETTGAVPYVFSYKKGEGVHAEAKADSIDGTLNMFIQIPGNWDRGKIETGLIGEAKSWDSLVWSTNADFDPQTDTISVVVLGLAEIGDLEEELMIVTEPGTYDLSNINSAEHPFLKLRFNVEDSIFRSAPNMNFWRILYEGVPEFAVNPALKYNFHSDTLQRGEPLTFEVAIENLIDIESDSLLVKLKLQNENNNERSYYQRYKPISISDSLIVKFNLETKDFMVGNQKLELEVNPENDQPEQTTINNFLQTGFFVNKDNKNPLLDVTFDGIHILDGDLVSPSPHIVITMRDENPFLLLDDTTHFKIFLVRPDSLQQELISFLDPIIQFIPATNSNNNKAMIQIDPVFTKDGVYSLLIQARDVSGNVAGAYDYNVDFNVITKSSISKFLPYPNPFTTSTRFVYTMTGSEQPAHYKLQISTVAGKIVREINQDDFGKLKPGTHLSDFVWNGTDQFGDKLAKGVYLYRFFIEDENGRQWESYDTGVDQYFQQSIGKIVLLR